MVTERRRLRTGFNIALGMRIRKRRLELERTLTEVAESAGMSKGHLSDVENGVRGLTLWSAAAICEQMGWGLDQMTKDLLWREEGGGRNGRHWRTR